MIGRARWHRGNICLDELKGREYYHPNDRGYEHEVSARLAKIRPILHGEDDKGWTLILPALASAVLFLLRV